MIPGLPSGNDKNLGRRGFQKIFILLCCALVGTGTFAATQNSCSSIRLDQNGYAFEKIPVKYQGQFGTCGSQVAVQIADYFRFSHDFPLGDRNYDHLSSAEEAAVGIYGNRWFSDEDFSEGANICKSMNSLLSRGTCAEKTLDRVFPHMSLLIVMSFFKSLHQAFQAHLAKTRNIRNWTQRIDPLREQISNFETSMRELAVDKSRLPDSYQIVRLLSINQKSDAYAAFINFFCDQEERLHFYRNIYCREVTNLKDRVEQRMVDESLDQVNPQPVGVSLCINKFVTGSNKDDKDKCGPHALVIIGREMKDGQCRYLMRNSWGTGCWSYKEGVECDHGNFWLNQNDLFAATYRLSFLAQEEVRFRPD